MEPNGVGMFSNSGMLGLEMSLHHHPQHHHQIPPPQQNPQNPTRHHQQMVAFGNPEAERRPQPPPKQVQPGYPFASKSKPLTISDEDEPNPTTEDSGGGGDGKRNNKGGSPWQRMKWTDNMVRLLIMVVFYIGDEVGSDQGGPDPSGGKKVKGGGAGGAVLQKKGKWKSVSRAMMERGFFVSPQQCEDKFNDLNKRYKRVNDILGKGTACKVVENQSLLETMDHLSLKMKEEVKKLLNSKHLFFREMCAYHSSCGGGAGGSGGGVHQSPPEVQAEPSHNQQQRCSHASDKSAPVSSREETDRSRMESYDDEDDDHDNDNDVDEDDDIDDDVVEMAHCGNGHNDEEGVLERNSRKRQRKEVALLQQFNNEVVGVVQDVTKSLWEKRQWMKTRLLQLEEARIGYEGQAFELEKQRLKWLKFSWKKEREMEGEKLKNERVKLENDRMVLILRQKEVELLDLQQHSTSMS